MHGVHSVGPKLGPSRGRFLSRGRPAWEAGAVRGPRGGSLHYPKGRVLRHAGVVKLERAQPDLELLGKDPVLTAALFATGVVDSRDLPLLAAHWVAEGRDGDSLVELAALTRSDVREISDLWPSVVAEVCPTFEPALGRRRAAAYLANEYLEGRIGLRWLLHVLWPDHDAGPSDKTLDGIVYQLDELADAIAARPSAAATRGLRLWPGAPTRAELEDELAGALNLLAAGDLVKAHEALGFIGST